MKTRKEYFKRLVIVAYRLPFKFVKKNDRINAIQNSGGLVSAILSLSQKSELYSDGSARNKILWFGKGENIPSSSSKTDVLENEHFEIFPVRIPSSLNEKYYGGFCNNLIWPMFHYFPSLAFFDRPYFDAYVKANRLFFNELRKHIRPGDFIWIHDYQLFLLPGMIREEFPDSTIGFFLHIPFPSFEIFRLMPREWRTSILEGMLGASLVGFHTKDYATYFKDAVRKTLHYRVGKNILHIGGREVVADAFPIGIDYHKFHAACMDCRTAAERKKIKRYIEGKKLVFSVDRLDYTKGILHRLAAYELFLLKHPEWHGRVIFNMVVVPSRDSISRYRKMKKEIDANVGRINGRFSTLAWRPLIYQYKSLNFNELTALYNLGDVGLITPLRDGMNLVAKEYISCQADKKGMLVLSEMAGAASELSEAILINPYDEKETSEAILAALEMPEEIKHEKIKKMQQCIRRYDVFKWANEFFKKAYSNSH